MRIVTIVSFILLAYGTAYTQTGSDVCHAYVIDVSKARAGLAGNGLSGAQTVFPEFRPMIGEEELTTKTYPFPKSSLSITASVYYTDESMASAGGSDSMLVGIVVSAKPQRDALSSPNNAVTEVTQSDNQYTVRVKKYMTVDRRLYLVGVECRCNEKTVQ